MNFAKQVKAFAKKAEQSIEQTHKAVSIKLFSAIIKDSPVDSGRFRANWQTSNTTPASGTTSATNDPTAEVVSYVASISSSVFTLSNNLPYAATIEYGGYPGSGPNTVNGFSRQAPYGVVRVNAARFERLLEQAARENR